MKNPDKVVEIDGKRYAVTLKRLTTFPAASRQMKIYQSCATMSYGRLVSGYWHKRMQRKWGTA